MVRREKTRLDIQGVSAFTPGLAWVSFAFSRISHPSLASMRKFPRIYVTMLSSNVPRYPWPFHMLTMCTTIGSYVVCCTAHFSYICNSFDMCYMYERLKINQTTTIQHALSQGCCLVWYMTLEDDISLACQVVQEPASPSRQVARDIDIPT